MFPKRQQGFTLLEVLLAGFILFLTIATMTMVYRGALLSSSKAEQSLQMSAAVLPVRQIITTGFREADFAEQRSGEGQYGNVVFLWTASLVQIGRPPSVVQEDMSMDGEIEYFLWRVNMRLTLGSVCRQYTFSEVSW